MKISLIGQSFDEGSGQGVYEFSNQLHKHLKKINKDVEIVEVGTSRNSFRTLFKNLFLSFFRISKSESDVYHFMMPEVAFPVFFKKHSIVTIHDVIPLIIKNERKKIFNLYFKLIMKIALKADYLIAVSQSTKRDIIKYFPFTENKITVIYEGVDHNKFFPIKKKRMRKNFVIGYVGGLGKRKNVEFILKLAKELKNNKKISFKIAGKGPEKEKLENMAKKMELRNVEFVGFIPDAKLNEFYNSLDLFLFPSLYEGFGLPVLEAMACGVPVMVSGVGSLVEISKEAGILINPEKPKDTVDKLKKLVRNPKLQKKLITKSLNKSKEFDWNKTARETFKIYEKIV